jgi:hypothetical protein
MTKNSEKTGKKTAVDDLDALRVRVAALSTACEALAKIGSDLTERIRILEAGNTKKTKVRAPRTEPDRYLKVDRRRGL